MVQSKISFSPRRFGGHDVTRSLKVDDELTKTGKGTPCGEYLRQHWQPICMVSEIGDKPHRIKVLGEDLILFRDLSGRLGLVHRNCLHRGASLEFGLITEDGIRCAYHGWHFAVDGSIVEAPAEASPGALGKCKFLGAYPTREYEGLVFAYLGAADNTPEFPVYDFMDAKGEKRVPYRWTLATNWLHVRENAQDPIHLSFLHSMFEVKQFGDFTLQVPYIRTYKTPIGLVTSSLRRMGNEFYYRINEMIMPNCARIPDVPAWGDAIPANLNNFLKPGEPDELKYKRLVPSSHGLGTTIYVLPHDDESCQMIGWLHVEDDEDPAVTDMALRVLSHGQVPDRPYAERQANPGDGDVLVSQGPNYSIENENLTTADVGIVLYRRSVRSAINSPRLPGSSTPSNASQSIRTYGYSLFRPAPPQGTAEEELQLRKNLDAQLIKSILDGTVEQTKRVLEPIEIQVAA